LNQKDYFEKINTCIHVSTQFFLFRFATGQLISRFILTVLVIPCIFVYR